jgi:hypothetical protein
MPKKIPPKTSHIIVGFSFPSERDPSEMVTGTTRYSIWLSMSSQLYARFLTAAGVNPSKSEAERLAEVAFELTDIYLKKLDSEVAKDIESFPPPPPVASKNSA